MNLRSFANHTVDVDLLGPEPTILDVGCRGFDFTRLILDYAPLSRVISMDADPAVTTDEGEYLCRALVGDVRETARFARYSTGEGNFITDLPEYYGATFIKVLCITIDMLMHICKVEHLDVVKLDCEGSEFGILENWPGPIATQISVEFHDSGYTPGYGPDYDYGPMFERLKGFGYKIVQHELSKQGDGTGHFDSLLVLA